MASLQKRKRKNGSAYVIQFMNGERKTLYLGAKYSYDEAVEVLRVVERCVDAIATESPLDRRTLAWLENMSDDLRARFIAADLIEDADMTLEQLFDLYERQRLSLLKAPTRAVFDFSRRVFFRFVDPSTPVSDFGRANAQEFADRIKVTRYAPATVCTIVRDAAKVFNYAVRQELLTASPFRFVSRGHMSNKRRERYIDLETFEKLIDACKTQEERALVAFYRIGGLRRAEPFGMTWRDIDFKHGRFVVHATKTEAHESGGDRVVPLFPRLRQELEKLPRTTLFTKITLSKVYNTLLRLTRQAGVERYPRLIQNLRSSRAIEIYREFGEVAENAWLGHTFSVAKSHYLHVLDDDFKRASRL